MTKCDVGSLEVHLTYKFVYIKNAEGIEAKRVYPFLGNKVTEHCTDGHSYMSGDALFGCGRYI